MMVVSVVGVHLEYCIKNLYNRKHSLQGDGIGTQKTPLSIKYIPNKIII